MTEPMFEHYGILRKSGRYPWGSGENPYQRSMDFYGMVDSLKKSGMSDGEVAKSLGLSSVTELRQNKTIARNQIRAADRSEATALRDKGMSVTAIGRQMGKNESSIRALLDDDLAAKQDVLENTVEALRNGLDKTGYLDIGGGNEHWIGVSRDKLNTAVAILESEGYRTYYVRQDQLGVPGNKTTIKVLATPEKAELSYKALVEDPGQIATIAAYSEDRGQTLQYMKPPKSVSKDRIQVVYGPDGGGERDGLIELRRGVDDLNMGSSNYAQVRILVDGTHYLKGVAVIRDDLPEGVDIRFNTPKKDTGNILDALKTVEPDPTNPFGASIRRQKTFVDADGNEQLTALNIVQEEGEWAEWGKTLSSQMLSKQTATFAKQQLDEFVDNRASELATIRSLTNPVLQEKLLVSYAEKVDADAVDLKAMGLPRTASHLVIPIPQMKDNEVYAPGYNHGETVVLIRHPHGGRFEIPQLVVNNKVRAAAEVLGTSPKDAIGINTTVAEQLSGADFDGDTVLVIPNNTGQVKTSRPLKGLENFNPRVQYAGYEGMKVMANTQAEMGAISNLITDMSILGATPNEIARAVRHSMVVIDAEKHKLNYKQSAIDNNIKELKSKYQTGGASTIISRASADHRVPTRKARPVSEGGKIDPKTGELRWVDKDDSFTITREDGSSETIKPTEKSSRMAETRDARSLMSSVNAPLMEQVYAAHANKLKGLANQARLDTLKLPKAPKSPAAETTYSKEVGELKAALVVARMNAPVERHAQLVAAAQVKLRLEANPALSAEPAKVRKIRAQELANARANLGAHKDRIDITPRQWEAIQSGALARTNVMDVLNNADPDKVLEYAMPRQQKTLPSGVESRVKSMLSRGYTQAEVAEAIGISTSLIAKVVK